MYIFCVITMRHATAAANESNNKPNRDVCWWKRYCWFVTRESTDKNAVTARLAAKARLRTVLGLDDDDVVRRIIMLLDGRDDAKARRRVCGRPRDCHPKNAVVIFLVLPFSTNKAIQCNGSSMTKSCSSRRALLSLRSGLHIIQHWVQSGDEKISGRQSFVYVVSVLLWSEPLAKDQLWYCTRTTRINCWETFLKITRPTINFIFPGPCERWRRAPPVHLVEVSPASPVGWCWVTHGRSKVHHLEAGECCVLFEW